MLFKLPPTFQPTDSIAEKSIYSLNHITVLFDSDKEVIINNNWLIINDWE